MNGHRCFDIWKVLFRSVVPAKGGSESRVTLVPEETAVLGAGSGIYRRYTAPDKKTALQFLHDQDVSAPSLFIVIETPEGVYAKDRFGIIDNSRPTDA